MIILQNLKELRTCIIKPVITIGNFDGVHLGHQALFARVIERAYAIGGTSMVVTFDQHPVRVLRSTVKLPLITPVLRKLSLIQACGIQVVLCLRFDKNLAKLSADSFINNFLVDRLGVMEIIVGYDFIFGHNGQGNLAFLQRKSLLAGYVVQALGPVLIDRLPVSSTRVRQLIKNSDMNGARRLLGRSYRVSGKIINGYSRGKCILGYPTANLRPENELYPGFGVYAVLVDLGIGKLTPGVTNIGMNPTFGNTNSTIETFLLEYQGNLYGQELVIYFVEFLRGEQYFHSVEELIIQITSDVEIVYALLTSYFC